MLLAVDSSTQWMGLALYDGSQVLSEVVWRTRNHHTVELAPAMLGLFERAGARPTDVQVLAAALGPGSFTSLRIGLAVVKGMAMAQHLPVVGIPTLDALAAAQPHSGLPLAAVLQAGRNRLALVWYDCTANGWQARGEPQVTTVEDLSAQIRKPTLVCGELDAAQRQILARKRRNVILSSPALSVRRPAYLAELAWQRWQAGQTDDVISLAPIYLHVAEAIPA